MVLADPSVRLTKVNHLTYNVLDKERATRFWVDVLGVKRIPSAVDGEHIIWLQLPSGTMVHLIEKLTASRSLPITAHSRLKTSTSAYELLKEKGVKIESPEIGVRNDGQRVFFISDTEGNRIEICTKSGFGVLV